MDFGITTVQQGPGQDSLQTFLIGDDLNLI